MRHALAAGAVAAILSCLSCHVSAQERAEIAGGLRSSGSSASGWFVSGAVGVWRGVSVVGEVSRQSHQPNLLLTGGSLASVPPDLLWVADYYYLGVDDARVTSVLGGVRYGLTNGRLRPYVRYLLGRARASMSAWEEYRIPLLPTERVEIPSLIQTFGIGQLGGGVDVMLTPVLAVRGSVEYQGWLDVWIEDSQAARLAEIRLQTLTASVGAVWKF